MDIPDWQREIRERCRHPQGTFLPFEREEIERPVGSRFEKQVRLHGGRTAVKTDSRQWTYNELNQAANRVAHAILAQRGARTERTAVLLEQGVPAIAAILGVFKAGKTCVPLDPAQPSARLGAIAEISESSLILTNNRHLDQARQVAGDRAVVNLDALDADLPEQNPEADVPPDALAWILFTSGSTGQPKGVMQTHRNVLHCIMNYTFYFKICPEDRLSMVSSLATHAGMFTTLLPLLAGAGLYPLDLKQVTPEFQAGWMQRHGITVSFMVPTVFRRFATAVAAGGEFPDLRLVYLAGEPALKTDFELYRKKLAERCILVNRLGSTETDCIRLFFADRNTAISTATVPVGYAVRDKEVLLLDEQGEPVAPGQPGEMAVKSSYITPGYWGRDDLTSRVLTQCAGGDRLYRTGDLGMMRDDGCIVHLGRKDLQVKIRGFRVETAEIEAALLERDEIREAAVVACSDQAGENRLAAYVVPRRQPGPTASELRQVLAARLPDYMVPAYFVNMEALPQAPNGKLLRRDLPAPESVRPALDEPFVAPRTWIEEELAALWIDVLGIDRVGVYDHFFDLGGDSLRATQIANRLHQALSTELSLRDFFQRPTVASQAEYLEQVLGTDSGAAALNAGE